MLTGLTQLEHLPDGLGLLGQSRASSAEGDLGSDVRTWYVFYSHVASCLLTDWI